MRRLAFTFLTSILVFQAFGQIPTMNCPGNTIVSNDPGACGAMVTYTIPTCATNCGSATIYQSDNNGFTSGDNFPVGIHFLQYTITNGADSTTCVFKVEVQDTEAPTVSFPASIPVYMDANCNYVLPDFSAQGIGSFSDNCFINNISQSPAIGTVINGAGTTSAIQLTTTDTTGNQTITNFDIILTDTIAPTISGCPSTITEPVTSGCQAMLQNYTALISATDNCGGTPVLSQSPVSGTSFSTSQSVTIYAQDQFGNIDSCVFTVVSDDVIAPTITCPNDTTVYVDSGCEYLLPDYTGLTIAIDNCDPNVSLTQMPIPGVKLTGYNTSHFVSITGADIAGNSSVCSFQITLLDSLAPSFGNCKDTTLYLDHNCEFSMPDLFTYVGVTENCSSISTAQFPNVGTILTGAQTLNVIYTATDLSNLSGTCAMDIILADTTSPNVVACQNDTTVGADATGCSYTVPDYSSSVFATDNCTSVFGITQSEVVGNQLNVGATYPIVMSVTDDAGNLGTCTFNLTVVDNLGPDLNCPVNPNVPVNANCEFVVPDYQTIVNPTDNCGNVTFSQTPNAGTVISGIGTQQSISLYATDDQGNQSSCSFIITLADTTAPVISCPGTQIVNIDQNCQYQIPDLSSLVIVTDLCDPNPTFSQSPAVGVTVSGMVDITVTVTDASGNFTTCIVQAQPNDVTNPSITCPTDMASCDDLFTWNTPAATDDCGLVTVAQTDVSGLISGDNFPVGITTIEYTATDNVGNTSTCSFDIEVYPSPSISFSGDHTIEEGDSVQLIPTLTNDSLISWSPALNLSSDTAAAPWASPTTTVDYTVVVIGYGGCTVSEGVTVFVNNEDELIINNFVSPNGDGKNDFWIVSNPSLISGCTVGIYDRWGKLVWESSDYDNEWNGLNSEGTELPDGTYFYQISCTTGEPMKGSILLMR